MNTNNKFIANFELLAKCGSVSFFYVVQQKQNARWRGNPNPRKLDTKPVKPKSTIFANLSSFVCKMSDCQLVWRIHSWHSSLFSGGTDCLGRLQRVNHQVCLYEPNPPAVQVKPAGGGGAGHCRGARHWNRWVWVGWCLVGDSNSKDRDTG